jgi:phage tail-like protein
MARSSTADPVEKFRFVVTILEDAGPRLSSSTTFTEESSTRAGFSEATIPRVVISEITHRENIDGFRPLKIAGLATFEPVTLKRGVTKDRSLYGWYRLVNDDSASINRFSEAISGLSVPAFQEPRYRKEVLISSLNRQGDYVKHWLLINAWPSAYQGGDSLNANTEEILLEELTLSYESFLEVSGNTIAEALRSAEAQAEEATRRQARSGILSTILGT